MKGQSYASVGRFYETVGSYLDRAIAAEHLSQTALATVGLHPALPIVDMVGRALRDRDHFDYTASELYSLLDAAYSLLIADVGRFKRITASGSKAS